MLKSLKQLLRTPVKAVLFFWLLVAATALLVFSVAVYTQTAQRIAAMEGQFTTLGTIEQPLLSSVTTNAWAAVMGEWALRKTDMPRAFRLTNWIFRRRST